MTPKQAPPGSFTLMPRQLCAGFLLLSLLLAFLGCHSSGPDKSKPTWVETWRSKNSLWRGVHLTLSTDQQAGQLIEEIPALAADGVNLVIVEVNYSYEYESHPELRTTQFVSKQRARQLVETSRANGIRLVPMLNCLGHQSWSKVTGPLLTKYPQFDETPGQFPENKDIYCRSWCPRHAGVNPVIFALIDELIEAFSADAVHVGMDEVFLIGSEHCPRCQGTSPALLFAGAVNDLRRHIVDQRKLEMLLWGDRLLDSRALGYSEWEASRNATCSAIDLIPKDVIICDWHYGKQDRYPSIPLFLEKGFRVLPSAWQPIEASKAFSACARQQGNPHMLGFLCTTWGKVKISEMAEWPPILEVLKEWR